MDGFLARFNSKRRHMLKREMAAAQEQGIAIRTIRGDEVRGWARRRTRSTAAPSTS